MKSHNKKGMKAKTFRGGYRFKRFEGQPDNRFISLDIPELLDHFFVLNGAKYIPSLYIVDLPISIKKNSISIYSLFNPVSFFISKNYIIVSGRNIPMSRFFSFFYSLLSFERFVPCQR